MKEEKREEFAVFLNRKFWEWQNGDPMKTRKDWAEWIHPELSEISLYSWMSGNKIPREMNAYRLALRYPEVLEILGIEEEYLQYIIAAWPNLSEDEKQMIKEQAEQYLEQEHKGDVGKGEVAGTVKATT